MIAEWGGVPSVLGNALEYSSSSMWVRRILEGEFREINKLCSSKHVYMWVEHLVVVVCSGVGTLRQFSGRLQISMEDSMGP